MASSSRRRDDGSEPLLPPDVILSILLWLPVKTLSRFRCVSKSWSSLISSPYFRSHYRGSQRNLVIFTTTCDEKEEQHSQTLDMQGRALRREVLDSCPNSDVVLSSLDLVCLYGLDDEIYIRNPTTGEHITLPNSPLQCSERKFSYDDRQLSFARANSTSDYKVVHFVRTVKYYAVGTHYVLGVGIRQRHRKVEAITCEVFSLGSRDWRVVPSPPSWVDLQGMVAFDGAVHLLPRHSRAQRVNNESRGIARFDLEKEEWSVCPLPGAYDFYHDRPMKVSLSQLGGRLCLECCRDMKLELWFQRGDDRNEWVKEHDIDVSVLGCSVSRTLTVEDGRVLLEMHDGRLQYYDPKDGRFEEIYYAGRNCSVTLYVESFTPFNER